MRRARQQAVKTEADLAFDIAVEREVDRLKGIADASMVCLRDKLSKELKRVKVPSVSGSSVHELAFLAARLLPRKNFQDMAVAIVSERLKKALSA